MIHDAEPTRLDQTKRCVNGEVARLKARIATVNKAADALIDAIHSVQDWSGTRIGDCAEALDAALEAQP
jgi:hypothetical protein